MEILDQANQNTCFKGADMNITLINLPFLYPFEQKHENTISHCVGLRSISSCLKRAGHRITFIDALSEGYFNARKYRGGYMIGLPFQQIVRRIPKDVDIIGVSVPFYQMAPIAHEVIEKIRKAFPGTMILMGGVYPSTQPKLALISEADYIVVGEGEEVFLSIAEGQDPGSLQGVYSRQDMDNEVFPCAKPIERLDELPFPDYSLFNDRYLHISPRGRIGKTASIHTSRGCPYNCKFCSVHAVSGRNYRYRSAESVLEEIKYLHQTFKIDVLEIEDDNFSLLKDRTIDILEGIIRLNENGANIQWRAPSGFRIDTLDETIVSLMKRSNNVGSGLALEHGDQSMLQIMRKKLDLDKAYRVIEIMSKYEIPLSLFLIVGYPGETDMRFKNSVKYLKKIIALNESIVAWPFYAQPLPGTELEATCIQENLIDPDYNNFLDPNKKINFPEGTVAITTSDFDAAEVTRRWNLLAEMFGTPEASTPGIKGKIKEALSRRTMFNLRNFRRRIEDSALPSYTGD